MLPMGGRKNVGVTSLRDQAGGFARFGERA